MENTTAASEYFMMRSENLTFKGVKLKGKYSFQYIKNAVFENCIFDTKDAFWHGENITVKNSVIKSENLARYSDGLTLIDCTLTGRIWVPEVGELIMDDEDAKGDVLIGEQIRDSCEVWSREDQLSLRDRSLVTVTVLMAQGLTDSSFRTV